ncbi:hypothetical protein FHS85_003691 [Rhodoligotrophos appendicifer]
MTRRYRACHKGSGPRRKSGLMVDGFSSLIGKILIGFDNWPAAGRPSSGLGEELGRGARQLLEGAGGQGGICPAWSGLCDVDLQPFNEGFWGNELAQWPIS